MNVSYLFKHANSPADDSYGFASQLLVNTNIREQWDPNPRLFISKTMNPIGNNIISTLLHCLLLSKILGDLSKLFQCRFEVYRDKPIIYGCSDFLNDYEGIRGHEDYQPDLALMYFVMLEPASGKLVRFQMVPMQIKRFRLSHTSESDTQWLAGTMNRQCERFGGGVESDNANLLSLNWQ